MRLASITQISLLICLGVVMTTASSCGGGTTGTSPTDGVRLSGFAEQSDGSRAPALSMAVRSGETDEVLVNSGTDEQGEFSMDLPSDEQSFVISVNQVGATSVSRNLRGDALASAKLVVTADNTLTTEHFSESQVDQGTLCEALTVSGDRLVVRGETGDKPCLVTIRAGASTTPLSDFVGILTATCDGKQTELDRLKLSSAGEATLDLNQAFAGQCSDIRITIQDPAEPELAQVFIVE